MQPAYAVVDAKNLQSAELRVLHRKLRALPEGLATLQHVRTVDASNNPISDITSGQLPPHITELTLTGCQLASVSACLTKLTGLQQLHLAANSIRHADAVFACPQLMHAGLSFNHISSLVTSQFTKTGGTALQARTTSPQRCSTTSTSHQHCSSASGSLAGHHPVSALSCSPLMSLDLSRNDITDLHGVIAALKQLSQLKSLSLKGNPISLLPQYRAALLACLPQLLYLDGQKVGGICMSGAGSRPSTTSSKWRPGSTRPDSASASSSTKFQEQPLAASFCNLTAPAAPEQVPLLIFLELNKQHLTEVTEQTFAVLAAESTRKQQQHLQDMAAGAAGDVPAAIASTPRSFSGSSDGGTSSSAATAAARVGSKQGSSKGSTAAPTTADASVSGTAAEDMLPAAPVQPIMYHMELKTPDGAMLCSLPLVIQPPKPQVAEPAALTAVPALADSKKGAAKGSKQAPAAAKARPGLVKIPAGKGRASVDNATEQDATVCRAQLTQGCLQVLLQLPVTVAGRDWLTDGFTVNVTRTLHKPVALVPQQLAPPAVTATPAAGVSTGSKRIPSASGKTPGSNSKTVRQAAAAAADNAADTLPSTGSSLVWHYETKQQILGTAKVVAGDLLDSCGQQQVFEGKADFMPPAPLFSEITGTLLSRKDATLKQSAAARCSYKLVLHHRPAEVAASAPTTT